METDVRVLADKQAITEQLYNYARAMDRIDNALGYTVWHEDGTADYGAIFNGTGRGFVDWVSTTHARMLSHAHRVSNPLITVDGDRAASEAYVHATLRFEEEGKQRQVSAFGRYLDRWSKRNGRWAIDHRTYVQDMDDVRDVGPQVIGGWGRRDREDPSYKVMEMQA